MDRRIIFLSFSIIFALIVSGCAPASERAGANGEEYPRVIGSEYHQFQLEKVAEGLEHPWSLAFLPDGRLLVTERPGRLNLIENGVVTEVSGVPEVRATNQGGLLDVSVHPGYEDNGWIYLTYSQPGEGDDTATTLGRGQLENHSFVNYEIVFEQDRYSSPGRHYGSRIAWTDDGTLYLSVGDRGADPPRAQATDDHAGSLLRLNDDGSVPEDNPFIGRDDVLPEIYSYGHRNIQGLAIDTVSGQIWATEHGPRGGDELNQIEAGSNYGWPVVTLGRDYGDESEFAHSETRSREGMIDPVHEFLPTHSPAGLAVVTSDHFPNWRGNLLAGGLRGERIRRVVVEDGEVLHEEELLYGVLGRIRDVRQGPDGYIYLLNDEADGGVFRLGPAE